jgi:hypothetical protein
LIARRCRVVIVSDAGCNNGLSEFGVLADLVRQMRLDHGVEILDLDHDLPLETDRIRRQADGRVTQHFLVGRIRYPRRDAAGGAKPMESDMSDRMGLFVYLQMSLTGDEDVDLSQFQKINPRFPDEPITNQFYSPDQVESLRQLGEHVGKHLCQRLDSYQIGRVKNHKDRVDELASALIAAYLLECRQENLVGVDDASPEWPARLRQLGDATAFEEFEERGEGCRDVIHFSSIVLDGYDREVFSLKDQPKDRELQSRVREFSGDIPPRSLASLAVECNRRHAGFRSESPSRYFRVGGRRLLLRSANRAVQLFQSTLDGEKSTDQSSKSENATWTVYRRSVARLAVLVKSGVFRHFGAETARDVTICALMWYAAKQPSGISAEEAKSQNTDEERPPESVVKDVAGEAPKTIAIEAKGDSDESGFDTWMKVAGRHAFREGLLAAIQTGLADEVDSFLDNALKENGRVPPHPGFRDTQGNLVDPFWSKK